MPIFLIIFLFQATVSNNKRIQENNTTKSVKRTTNNNSSTNTNNNNNNNNNNNDEDDDDWEKFQAGIIKKDRVLEGRSKESHSVHCPYFPEVRYNAVYSVSIALEIDISYRTNYFDS